MRVLGLVPARGGSKGLPRKNVRFLCGKPLLQYTAEAALAAHGLARVVLSTEDEEIADIGRACGLAVPFVRPRALADDDTPMLPVVAHALRALAVGGEQYDAVCLLQPTAPLRRAADIDACIALLTQRGADTVLSVSPVPPQYHPHWVYFQNAAGQLALCTGATVPPPRRQDLAPAFHRDGAVYVTRTAVILEDGSLYGRRIVGYVVAAERSVNIDGPDDWERAARLLAARGTDHAFLPPVGVS